MTDTFHPHPAYIHELPGWPAFTWNSALLAGQLASVRHHQGLLLGRLHSLGFDLRSEACLTSISSEIVTSSAIEGERLDAEEVRSSIARHLGLDIAGISTARDIHISRDVEGVVEMMLDAVQKFDQPLTRERLFDWHASLFPTKRSGMRLLKSVGQWRTDESGPMQVVSGPIGRENIHFEAPRADRIESEMAAFLNWFNDEGQAGSHTLDPVIKSAISHFWFVTIHPFEDGNGRIARAIADLALARADGMKDRFYSMSAQIQAERNDYYRRLESSQKKSDLDITDWLAWFLACLDRALARAETTLAHVLYKAEFWRLANQRPLNDRQRLVLDRLLDPDFQGFLNTSKYAKLARCSNDTALRDMNELRTRGLILQNPGGGRSTSYRLPENL